jgi:hypothetical protein
MRSSAPRKELSPRRRREHGEGIRCNVRGIFSIASNNHGTNTANKTFSLWALCLRSELALGEGAVTAGVDVAIDAAGAIVDTDRSPGLPVRIQFLRRQPVRGYWRD